MKSERVVKMSFSIATKRTNISTRSKSESPTKRSRIKKVRFKDDTNIPNGINELQNGMIELANEINEFNVEKCLELNKFKEWGSNLTFDKFKQNEIISKEWEKLDKRQQEDIEKGFYSKDHYLEHFIDWVILKTFQKLI